MFVTTLQTRVDLTDNEKHIFEFLTVVKGFIVKASLSASQAVANTDGAN